MKKIILAAVSAAALAVSLTMGATAPASAQSIYFGFGTPGYTHYEPYGDYVYYNHYRGTRQRVPGYRYYQGYWFPPAAFFGLFLGPTVRGSHMSAHVQWCYDHYRSYRASDNTFQPYRGPRQQCHSPYSY
jgi:hypothetical protein